VDDHNRGPVQVEPGLRPRIERDVPGLDAVMRGDDVLEATVHPVDDAAERAEVLGDGAEITRQDMPLDPLIDADVGTAEAVDRLLRVADEEEPSRRRAQLAPVARGDP